MKQLIISIGREFGSGGHEIGEKLSELYNIPLYDRNLLKEIASERNLDHATLEEYDEKKKRFVIYRKVRGMDASPEVAVAHLQFNYLKDKAAAGESFVVMGRCAETMLKDNENMIPIFILADEEDKMERVMRIYEKNQKEAIDLMNYKDKARKDYHNHFCPIKWGDSRNYELSINSSKLGIDGTVKIIAEYINARIL